MSRSGELVDCKLSDNDIEQMTELVSDHRAAKHTLEMALREAYEIMRDVSAREEALWQKIALSNDLDVEHFVYVFDGSKKAVRRIPKSQKDW